ncbi:FMRFamide receptor, partial [Orchesella cincta]
MPNETILPLWACYFFEAPDNGEDLIFVSPYENNETVYKCILKSEYLFGKKDGPLLNLILGVILGIIGTIGALANCANIVVLKQLTKNSNLYLLLILLALFDFVVCTFSISTTVFGQLVLNDVYRGWFALKAVQVSNAVFALGRTGSVYITILITIERILVVSYPLHFKTWMTSTRVRIILGLWLLFIVIINSPLWLNNVLVENETWKFPGTEMSKFPYIFSDTTFATEIYSKILPWDTVIDSLLPIPLLLMMNGILYYAIHKCTKRREQLTRSQTKEVNAAKMFATLATILFAFHSFGVAHLFITQATGVFYHELIFMIYMAMAINSCVNFFIYYATIKYFREKF